MSQQTPAPIQPYPKGGHERVLIIDFGRNGPAVHSGGPRRGGGQSAALFRLRMGLRFRRRAVREGDAARVQRTAADLEEVLRHAMSPEIRDVLARAMR